MQTKKQARLWLSVCVMMLIWNVQVLLTGQALSTIRGTVTDAAGAVAAGVTITVTEINTNVRVRTVTTNAEGDFEVPDVIPGTYRLTAELPGFKTYVADKLVVEGAQIRRVDIRLELGQIAEQITVQEGVAAITTDSAQISSGLRRQIYDNTPMVRNYYPHSLLVTLPGVESQASSWNLRIYGQPPGQIALGMDGVTNDGTVNLVNRLDFSEITVTGVNNTADQARVGNYNMISKRGSNEFHGEAFYTHFNSALNARTFFDPRKPAEKEHRGQISVSGPIIRNRTFFYVSYFYLKLPAGFYYIRTVPTNKMRAGDFSQITTPVVDPLNGQPFPERIVPASRHSAVSLNIQNNFLPAPNLGGPDTLVNNYGFLHPFPNDLFEARYPQIRFDHNFSQNNTIFGRWIRRRTPYVLSRSYPQFVWTRFRSHTHTVITDTHVFSPRLVNTFRFGLKTDYIEDGKVTAGVAPLKADDAIQRMGIQGVNQAGLRDVQGSPAITITGFDPINMQGGGVVGDDYQYSYAESLTYSVGRHVLKFGGELKDVRTFLGSIPDPAFGRFTFNGNMSRVPYADFLLGLPFQSERLNPLVNRDRYAKEFGVFAMDTFKVTQKLTLDYGLRWDYFTAPRFRDGLQYAWDPSTGNVVVSQAALSRVSPLYPSNITVIAGNVLPSPSKRNFRPRLGVAYRLADNLVIRGGYGIFTEQIGYFTHLDGGGPFQISETYLNEIQNGRPLFSFPNPFPETLASARVPSQNITAFPMQTRNGSIHQFNLTVERQLADMGVRLSYVGSRSRGLNYSLNINKPQPGLIPFAQSRRPFPQFVNITSWLNDGANNYDSFQLEVQRKVGSVLTFDAHYTIQSSLSNNLNLENPYNHYFWNREAFSARHRAVISTMIELPFGRGRKYLSGAHGALNQIVNGWRVMTVSNFRTGQFFSATYSGSDRSNTATVGGLPDRICDGNLPDDQRSIQRWFDVSCFAPPPVGRFGNSGVNVLTRPGLHLHHMSLVKEFSLKERLRLEYTAGISNIFNHPTFDTPRTDISVPGAGQITSILFGSDIAIEKTRAREIEMTLRLRW